MNGLMADLRFALRLFRRSPAFAATAVAILALGIGSATALFSVVDATLLRPLPFPAPDRLVSVVSEDRVHHFRGAASPPDLVDFRASVPALSHVAATTPWSPAATGDGEPERLHGLLVSANFFEMLGVRAAKGRTFAAPEETPGREHVAVVGDALWRRRWGADPGLVGRTIRLNGEPYEIVGIMPERFRWGRSYGRNADAEIWAPFALTPGRLAPGERGDEYLDLIGRLRPGVSRDAAQAQVDALIERFRTDYPDQFPRQSPVVTRLVPLQTDVVGGARTALWVLFGAVGLLLLIACTNVAGLFLARAAERRGEIAVRIALGAGRARLARQLVVEGGVLAIVAAAAGAGAASAGLRLLQRHPPAALPAIRGAALDLRSIAFAFLVSGATAIAFGLAPLADAVAGNIRRSIEEGRAIAARGEGRLRRTLVAGQLALATLLLVGAALLGVSLARVLRVDPGFDARNVLTGDVALARARYPDARTRDAFRRNVIDRLRSTPGVLDAGAVSVLPFGGSANSGTFAIEGRPVARGDRMPHGESWAATPGYFSTMGIALRRGRLFTDADRDGSLPVALIDDTLARAYFPGEDAVGRRIDFEGDVDAPRWRVVVGIVAAVRARALAEEAQPAFYVPFAQSHESIATFVARVAGRPGRSASAMRAAVAAADPLQPLGTVAPLEELLSASVGDRRIAAGLLSAFAAAAGLLAAVGLYGALAFSVARRRREIGIRIALGAGRRTIAAMVLGESGRMIAAGLAAGLAASVLLTRFLSTLLFAVAAIDPAVFGAVALGLTAVALAATLLPARRAARVHPMEALRYE